MFTFKPYKVNVFFQDFQLLIEPVYRAKWPS
jgi:hypothetical protein